MRRLRIFLLALPLFTGGCMPHVMHGPRVEDGTTQALSLSVGRQMAAGNRDETMVPSIYAGLRKGTVSEDSAGAYSIGAQIPPLMLLGFLGTDDNEDFLRLLFATSYVDLYVQPRGARGRQWDMGAGALASSAVFAPYVQFGRRRGDSQDGWYSTQMVAVAGSEFEDLAFWMPSFGWRDRGGRYSGTAVDIDLSAVVPWRGADVREWMVFVTFTTEFGLPREKR